MNKDACNAKALGLRVKEYRIQMGYTQEELANFVDVGVSHISNIEVGNTTPSLPTLINLANTLCVTADRLLCDSLTEASDTYAKECSEIFKDCDIYEMKFLNELLKSGLQIYRNDKQRRNE